MPVTVSLCIPALQSEAHLAHTVRRCLAQVDVEHEVVVLDNHSTDRTPQVLADLRHPRLRVVRNDRTLPMAENWNALVDLARGEFVKVVCDDDLVRRDAVSRQVRLLHRDPGLALVASRRHLIDDDGVLLATGVGLRGLLHRVEPDEVVRRVVRSGGNPIGEPGGVLFRRADFHAVGGFDGRLLFPMDLDLWIRLLERGAFWGQPEALAAFRVSRQSLSGALSRQQYQEQRDLTRRLAHDPRWQVPTADRWIGEVGARYARLRRHVLFGVLGRRPLV